jgi:hypothetical protein
VKVLWVSSVTVETDKDTQQLGFVSAQEHFVDYCTCMRGCEAIWVLLSTQTESDLRQWQNCTFLYPPDAGGGGGCVNLYT